MYSFRSNAKKKALSIIFIVMQNIICNEYKSYNIHMLWTYSLKTHQHDCCNAIGKAHKPDSKSTMTAFHIFPPLKLFCVNIDPSTTDPPFTAIEIRPAQHEKTNILVNCFILVMSVYLDSVTVKCKMNCLWYHRNKNHVCD